MKQKVVQFSKLAAALCLFLGLWGGIASAQNRGITVKGSVVDGDGLPVIGAGVTLQGTTTGVAADADGNFSLVVPGETGSGTTPRPWTPRSWSRTARRPRPPSRAR